MIRAAKIIINLCLLALLLTVIVCTAESCSTKKKATERSRSQTEIRLDNTVSENENRLEQNDCTAVRTTTIDWKSIQEALQVKPVDPDKPGKVSFTPETSGGFTVETENAELNTSKVQEEKQEINIDSIYQAKQLQLRREYEARFQALLKEKERIRKAKVETERLNTLISIGLGLGLGAFVLILFIMPYLKSFKFLEK